MLARRTALLLTPPDLVDSADTALLLTPPLVNPADTALLSTSPKQDSGLSAARLSYSRALSPHRGQGETKAEKAASAQSASGGEEDIGPREGSEAHDQQEGAGEHGGTGSGEMKACIRDRVARGVPADDPYVRRFPVPAGEHCRDNREKTARNEESEKECASERKGERERMYDCTLQTY